MKKLIFGLMMICMMVMSCRVVWADVYMPPAYMSVLPVLVLVMTILATILGISLVSFIVGKKIKSENLVTKANKYFERSLYLIFVLIIASKLIEYSDFWIMIPSMFLLAIIVSIFLRTAKKEKIISYVLLLHTIFIDITLSSYDNVYGNFLIISILGLICLIFMNKKEYQNVEKKGRKAFEWILYFVAICFLSCFSYELFFNSSNGFLNIGPDTLISLFVVITNIVTIISAYLRTKDKKKSYLLLLLYFISYLIIMFYLRTEILVKTLLTIRNWL